jgi:hypothetical protein
LHVLLITGLRILLVTRGAVLAGCTPASAPAAATRVTSTTGLLVA